MAEAARQAAAKPKLGAQGTVKLPAEIFAEPFHNAVVYEAVRAEQLARRRGTAATRTRGEVSGGGAKPWRQKGTGRARAGSIRLPHWTGGGVAFGPTPRDYTVKVNRKARRRALRAALSVHARRGSIAVVDASAYDEPSTRTAAKALDSLDSPRPGAGPARRRGGGLREVVPQHRRGWSCCRRASAAWRTWSGRRTLVVSEAALDELAEATQPRPSAQRARESAG